MAKKVLIFTKKVLPNSNTFVAAQALNLPTMEPVFIGFSKDKSGISLIQDKDFFVQDNYQLFPFLAKLALEKFSYVGKSWETVLRDQQPNLIHAHFGKGGFYCAPIAKKLALPLITTFHGSDITQIDKFSYNQAHRNVVYQRSNKIIAASKFIEQKLIERGCPQDKIVQHYTGLDTQFFSATDDKTNYPSILFVGRLIKQKGCHYLLKAMHAINQAIPEARLIIAGNGVELKALETQASTLKNISFVGKQTAEQVKALMAKSWLLCAPSINMARGNEEGLGMVFLEAQSMKTPVVSFKTGGVAEAVDHDKTGFLVPEKDVGALSEALLLLLSSNSLRERFAQQGEDFIKENFDISKQCKKLENVYQGIL